MPLAVAGAYFPDVPGIVLSDQLDTARARTVLAHELAHHHYGHRPHPSSAEMDRMERKAQRWAAEKLITFDELEDALRWGSNIFEVAEELQVDPELLEVRMKMLTEDERRELGL